MAETCSLAETAVLSRIAHRRQVHDLEDKIWELKQTPKPSATQHSENGQETLGV
jgi:hypothetical protein